MTPRPSSKSCSDDVLELAKRARFQRAMPAIFGAEHPRSATCDAIESRGPVIIDPKERRVAPDDDIDARQEADIKAAQDALDRVRADEAEEEAQEAAVTPTDPNAPPPQDGGGGTVPPVETPPPPADTPPPDGGPVQTPVDPGVPPADGGPVPVDPVPPVPPVDAPPPVTDADLHAHVSAAIDAVEHKIHEFADEATAGATTDELNVRMGELTDLIANLRAALDAVVQAATPPAPAPGGPVPPGTSPAAGPVPPAANI